MQAETVATAAGGPYAGTNDDDVLWSVFAGRGMGYFAAALDGNDIEPVANFSLPPAAGAPTGTLTGTVTAVDGGRPVTGARVEIGGHNSGLGSDLAATTGVDGKYTLSGVPNGTYPYVFVGGPGYDRVVVEDVAVSGTTTRNFALRRNWAQRDGGGSVSSFSPPDLSGFGCGPTGAIDGSQATRLGEHVAHQQPGPGRREAGHGQAPEGDHALAVLGRPGRDLRRRRQRVGRQLQDRDLDERHDVHAGERSGTFTATRTTR